MSHSSGVCPLLYMMIIGRTLVSERATISIGISLVDGNFPGSFAASSLCTTVSSKPLLTRNPQRKKLCEEKKPISLLIGTHKGAFILKSDDSQKIGNFRNRFFLDISDIISCSIRLLVTAQTQHQIEVVGLPWGPIAGNGGRAKVWIGRRTRRTVPKSIPVSSGRPAGMSPVIPSCASVSIQ
jgi:hypothetical protein